MTRIRSFATVFFAFAITATASGGDPLSPKDRRGEALWQDLSDGQLDQHPLFTAALIAGGVTEEEELQRDEKGFERLVNLCEQRLSNEGKRLPAAVTLFRVLHEESLSGSFCDSAWQVNRTLKGGPFNCVTSTVLYLSLCRRFDVQASAVAQQNHVYCRLIDDAAMDVQTTCGEWFDADGQPQLGAVGQVPIGQPRLISETQLLGKVYYNRAVSLSIAQQCQPAIIHFRRALHLDPQDTAARQNLLAAMNNGALQLSDVGQHQRAAKLIVAGLEMEPDHHELLANDLHVHQQWAMQLCQSGGFGRAVRILEACHRRRDDVELFDLGRWSVYRMWAESLLERQQVEEVHALFATARTRHGDHPELQACEKAIWSQHRHDVTHTASP